MKFWQDLSIVRRIYIGFTLLLLAMISIAGVSLLQGNLQSERTHIVTEVISPYMVELNRVTVHLLTSQALANSYFTPLDADIYTTIESQFLKTMSAMMKNCWSWMRCSPNSTNIKLIC